MWIDRSNTARADLKIRFYTPHRFCEMRFLQSELWHCCGIEAAFDAYFAAPDGQQRDWHFQHTPNSVWKNRNALKHADGGGEVIKRHMVMESKF